MSGHFLVDFSTHHPFLDVWVEVDCPACGLDYDLDPPPAPGQEVRCPCGHLFTAQELASANWYGVPEE